MLKYLKLKLWITIVLLSYSTSLFASNPSISPTGEVVNVVDSVLIAYDDLRIVNSKLIELEYEKETNSKLKNIIHNDSIIINNCIILNDKLNKDYRKAVKQRNICIGVSIISIILSSIFIFK